MKKFRVRFFGLGAVGECEIPFNHEPTVDEIEDMVAMYLDQGLLNLHLDRFYVKQKWWITYEEVTEEKEKELILGTWV
jgi:hypothetical protein